MQPFKFKGTTYSICEKVPSASPCMCFRPPHQCGSGAQCSPGYRCVISPFLGSRRVCLHCRFVYMAGEVAQYDGEQIFIPVDSGSRCKPWFTPLATPSRADSGQSWTQCHSSYDCTGSRYCAASRLEVASAPCASKFSSACFCRPTEEPEECSSLSQCLTGDRCVKYVISLDHAREHYCVGCSYVRSGVDVIPVDDGDQNCMFSSK